MAMTAVVSEVDAVCRLEAAVRVRSGGADILMNHPAVHREAECSADGQLAGRARRQSVGVIHRTPIFVPGMTARGRRGLIINTRSE